MTTDISLNLTQPTFFEISEISTGAAELFPAVWGAAEGLASPDVKIRTAALERLVELGAPRLSPLVAYLVATRLSDPDLGLRCRVIKVAGELLSLDDQGRLAPEPVRRHLSAHLAQMRNRSIFCLLEAASHDPQTAPNIARLLNACPHAGNHLADILSNRNAPLAIRRQAAHFIGRVGFLDTLPVLERLSTRLEARLNGQQSMPFAPSSAPDEADLLPSIQYALHQLRSTT